MSKCSAWPRPRLCTLLGLALLLGGCGNGCGTTTVMGGAHGSTSGSSSTSRGASGATSGTGSGATSTGGSGHATSGSATGTAGGSGGSSGGPKVDAGGCGLRTCLGAGANCGPLGDGCDGILECGQCDAPAICGGGGIPSVCGGGDAGPPCTGLCLQQMSCPSGQTTTLSGTVYAPTNPDAGFGLPDPLPNALVYIPNGAVDPFGPTVSCDVCGAPASGNPLVSATSGPDGTFTLSNVPVGTNIPLVIQLGRWRRQITIPTVTGCQDNPLTADQTRMPRNRTEGDIPRIAMVTGAVDSIECVLWKMGIDQSEFTGAGGPDAGRVQFYLANGATDPTQSAPGEESLVSNLSTLEKYDLVIFACIGSEQDQSTHDQGNLIQYANAGGRIYATHYSYVWLFNDAPFSSTAQWSTSDEGRNDNPTPDQVTINTSFPKGALLAQWLQTVGATSSPGQIPMYNLRRDFLAANPPSETWLTDVNPGVSTPPGPWPLHYTFNTPVDVPDGGAQCGRVVFSDFHVENQQGDMGDVFPSECQVGPLTPQEKVLEFMLFDLASCVVQPTPPPPPSCMPLTCADQGFECGPAGDGCGGLLQCGACDGGSCGGSGKANQCGASTVLR